MVGERTIADCVELQRGNTYKSARLGEPGPYLLGLASIRPEGGFRDDNLRTYGGESNDKLLVRPGDIYVSLKDVTQSGSLLGSVARVPAGIEVGRVTQDTVKLLIKSGAPDLSYIYWLLRTPQYRTYCRERAIGTTNLSLAREDFLSFEVPEYQSSRQELVALLDDLESKIELNRRMARTLEATAKALFQSWFVDFEPVRAKMEGRHTSLHADAAELFPDHFRGDGLPEGWNPTPLSSMARFLNGLALQKFAAKPGSPSLPVIKIAEMRNGIKPNSGRASIDLPSPDYVVEDGDHLFSWSGSLTQCLWSHGTGALNQHLFKVIPSGYPAWLLYFAVDHFLPQFQAIAADKAVTMGHIQRRHLDEATLALPHPEIIEVLDRTMSPLFERLKALPLETRTLGGLRDALLPRLISGELRISDAEALVKEAA